MTKLTLKFKGGAGSGNFGHGGRPGKVGGSGKDRGGAMKKTDQQLINEGAAKAKIFTGLYLKAKKSMVHGIRKDATKIMIARQDKANFIKAISGEFPVKLSSPDSQFAYRTNNNKYQIVGSLKKYRLTESSPMGVWEIKIYDLDNE